MSQPDNRELANDPGEDTIENIAGAITDGGEGDEDEGQGEDEGADTAGGDHAEQDEGGEGSEGGEGTDEGEGSQEDPEFEVEIGGKTERVKLSNLRAGYMMQSDYQRKTAEVADLRRGAEQLSQHYQEKLQNAANQLDVHLASLQQTLIGSQPKPELIESDPQEYLRQQSEHQQRVRQFDAAMQQRQAIQAEQAEQSQRQLQQVAVEENRKLLEKLPTWRDEKTRTAEAAEISRYLADIGYTSDEVNGLMDHRALLIARDAAKFRQLQAAKAKQTQPPPPKPVRPGASAHGARPNNQAQKAHERLQRNPNDMDALVGLVGTTN